MQPLRIIYFTLLAGMLLFALILEIVPVLDGILPSGTMLEFGCEYVLAIITLGLVYLALRLIKKNIVLRMTMLELPTFANLIFYHAFMNSSFGYLAVICFIAFAFVFPPKQDEELNNTKN